MKLSLRFIFLFLVFASKAFAVDAASNDLIKLLNNIHNMQADFTQILYDNKGKATQKSFGSMALQRPGKFRWDIKKPQPQLIIANEKKLWIYDADLEQLTIRQLEKDADDTPALLLSHDNLNLENKYIIKTLPNNKPGWLWFSLKAKITDTMFQAMQLGFVGNQIHEMRLQDNLGRETVVKFENIKLNASMNANLFTIKPSSKVDIIDETRKKI